MTHRFNILTCTFAKLPVTIINDSKQEETKESFLNCF